MKPPKTRKKLEKQVKKLRSKLSAFYKLNPKQSFNYKQLAARLEIKDPHLRQILISVIESMVRDKLLEEERTGKFKWSGPMDEYEGVIQFNRSGTAFLTVAGFGKDVMIPEGFTGTALNEDRVTIRLLNNPKTGRPKGKVVDILERARTRFPGIVQISQKFAFVVPDNPKIPVDFFVSKEKLNGAKDGQKVVVELKDWPDSAASPFGDIVEILGTPGAPTTESDAILAGFGFPLRFPEQVEAEAQAISHTIGESEVQRRRDLREVLTFTIDPADAKDFDDALSFETLKNGHRAIGVHIADVTHYVTKNSSIEKEAANRATSIYLVDRVIPMLPEVLSNNLCSLRPHEDKLCFSVVFTFDDNDKLIDRWIGKTVIHSNHRFTYEDAQKVIESGNGEHSKAILEINRLAVQIREQRLNSGAIAFNKAEVKFELNEKKEPTRVFFKTQKEAHKLIEEFMLLANKAVSEKVGKKTEKHHKVKPFVYRIHDHPDPLKLQEFSDFVRRFGHKVDLSNPSRIGNSINALLKKVEGQPEENLISMMAIRSMAKAEYSTRNIGHFGLGFDHYSHFTSPIRRYPDMIAHRLLFNYLTEDKPVQEAEIEKSCRHSSIMERKAVEAERESSKFYQVLFMQKHEGHEFDGVVSGVTEWGIYVELNENKCEGMVRMRDIDGDFFYYDEKNFCIRGQRTGDVISLGDDVRVKVTKADLASRRIDMKLVD